LTQNGALIVEWVAHMDAGDRRMWTADQDLRPLSEFGWRQAERLCAELATSSLDGLFSSPALRSRQTIEPLAKRFDLAIQVLPGLHEMGDWQPPDPWRRRDFATMDPLSGAYASGLAMSAVRTIRQLHPSGRVVACSHGDIQPALVLHLMGAYGLDVLPPVLPPGPWMRGGWYTLLFEGERVEVEHHGVLPDFPQP
jgi:8-oxo-dGTP diphosphatase